MRDPHVVSLRYNLTADNESTFKNCKPLEYETDTYEISLKDYIVTCKFKNHYDSIELAKQQLEKLLKSWEIDASLNFGKDEIAFKYLDAEVIDRNPGSPGDLNIFVEPATVITTCYSVTIHITRSKYPDVPKDFEVNPDVEILWCRFKMYLEGREPLQSMGYFCLSYLEFLTGVRKRSDRILIQNKYNIEISVINKLGDLTSEKGEYITARKARSNSFQPLTSNEKSWIVECVKKIIRRLGEYQKYPQSLTMITLNDLPAI